MPIMYKGLSLRCSPGWGNTSLCCDAVRGEGAEREQWLLLHSPPDFNHSLCYPQSNCALWCWFPSGWACACSRPLWVSLNLSCEAGSLSCCRPNPQGRFQSEVWGFISPSWSPGLRSGLLLCPSFVRPVYLWANVVPQGATCHSACPTLRHSESGPLGLSAQMWGRRVC